MSYESLLNLTCTVLEKTKTPSGSGAVKFTWTTKATGVKTRKVRNLQPKIFDEIAKTYVDEYKFYFLNGVDIDEANRIELEDGRIFEIKSIDNDSSIHHQKAYGKLTKQ